MFVEAGIHQGGRAFKTREDCFRISKNVSLDNILGNLNFIQIRTFLLFVKTI